MERVELRDRTNERCHIAELELFEGARRFPVAEELVRGVSGARPDPIVGPSKGEVPGREAVPERMRAEAQCVRPLREETDAGHVGSLEVLLHLARHVIGVQPAIPILKDQRHPVLVVELIPLKLRCFRTTTAFPVNEAVGRPSGAYMTDPPPSEPSKRNATLWSSTMTGFPFS